jgi:ceramide glucosyltransferase
VFESDLMVLEIFVYLVLGIATFPFFYYLIALYSSWRFFRQPADQNPDFTPPVSILKPVRGLDPNAYQNFASFCQQDYPEYEVVFCVDSDDPAVAILEKLKIDFPKCDIRLLFGSGSHFINDKVARLERLTNEAKYDYFVITDGDVRVEPTYLRLVVGTFENPKLGAATCLYASEANTFLQRVQSISMISDFFAGIIVAWQLDGVKFTLAQTILTTRRNVNGFGGYRAIGDRPADDLYIGRFASEQGLDTKLLPYVVQTVPDFESLNQLLRKRVRWMTVMRHMRPNGHFGLLFTFGLPWSLAAIAVHPTTAVGIGYLGTYLLLRILMTWLIGIRGMKQKELWSKMALIPLWDLMAFGIWLASFVQTTIRWRGIDYHLRNGRLTLLGNDAAEKA